MQQSNTAWKKVRNLDTLVEQIRVVVFLEVAISITKDMSQNGAGTSKVVRPCKNDNHLVGF